MALNKYNMDLKRIKKLYRNKFIVLCHPDDPKTPQKYHKYQIIDILFQESEKNLIFLINDSKTIRKIALSQEVLKTGKDVIRLKNKNVQCRIVNARNFPIIDSSYLGID